MLTGSVVKGEVLPTPLPRTDPSGQMALKSVS